jgi:RNA polymerase sigma factor (sigma-70 family)
MEGRSWPVSSRSAIGDCYDATFDEVFGYATRLTGDRRRAEDLVADAYLGLVRASRAGQVTAIGVGWLITAVRHRFIDELRSSERESRRLRLVERRGEAEQIDPADDRTGQLLSSLSDRERAAVVLRYVDDLSVAEVARRLSVSIRAAESLLARARARVRGSEVRDA